MRRAARVDNTQAPIVEALRAAGASVQSLASIGRGCPDLLVGYRMKWFVIECKSPGGKLTTDECAWIQGQRAAVYVVNSVEGALEAIGAVALPQLDRPVTADLRTAKRT
jgi:hypothetical protein